jgi:hypothetical protein
MKKGNLGAVIFYTVLAIVALALGFLMMSCEKKKKVPRVPTGKVLPSDGADYFRVYANAPSDPGAGKVQWMAFANAREHPWMTITGCQEGRYQYRPECTKLTTRNQPIVLKEGDTFTVMFEPLSNP